jgi:hypothetical protein
MLDLVARVVPKTTILANPDGQYDSIVSKRWFFEKEPRKEEKFRSKQHHRGGIVKPPKSKVSHLPNGGSNRDSVRRWATRPTG